MEKIISNWKKNAQKSEDRNFRFLTKLKQKSNQKRIDRHAKALHHKAFEQIDCLQCGNCCKTSGAGITPEDLSRISAVLNLTEEAFTAKYLERDGYGQLQITTLPCPFLGEENVCTIYEDRPEDCREFPHTYKDDFTSRRYMHSANTVDCPAVFYIVEQLRLIT